MEVGENMAAQVGLLRAMLRRETRMLRTFEVAGETVSVVVGSSSLEVGREALSVPTIRRRSPEGSRSWCCIVDTQMRHG